MEERIKMMRCCIEITALLALSAGRPIAFSQALLNRQLKSQGSIQAHSNPYHTPRLYALSLVLTFYESLLYELYFLSKVKYVFTAERASKQLDKDTKTNISKRSRQCRDLFNDHWRSHL
jgi:hypothetical protein